MENRRPKIKRGPRSRRTLSARKSKSDLSALSDDPLHIRRCHLCDHVNEQAGEVVSRCANCGKFMAPFYFFNELKVATISEAETRPEPPPKEKLGEERLPIRGLSTYW